MLKLAVVAFCSLTISVWANEFSILHTPEAIEFQPSSTIDLRTVKDVFTAALGISVKHDHRWSGLNIKNPFETAEAVVSFIIPGLSSLNFLHAHDYDLIINDNTDNIYDYLVNHLSQNQTTVKVTFKTSEPEMESSIDVLTGVVTETTPYSEIKKFDLEKNIDKAFVGNVHLLKAVALKALVGKSDGVPDVYWYSLPVVQDFIDESTSANDEDKLVEAENLLIKTISSITEEYSKFYNGKVLVATLLGTEMSSNSKRFRRAAEVTQTEKLNLGAGEEYDADFPIIFNILLWFAIAFIFTLLAISLAIGNMDPGRDSIIYRMTSTRIKKDS
uniref:Renin receptor n=1 Tax=Cacopsylla melanoneura TaxID=428564 RepID=A0A8D8UG10_9HEMI